MSAMPPKAEVAYDLRLASDEIGREVATLPAKLAKRVSMKHKSKPPVC